MSTYAEAHERVFGPRKRMRSGRYMVRDDKLVPSAGVRQFDSKNIRSVSSGVGVSQVAEFNRQFGDLGVRYDQVSGDAIYKDRASKLRVMKKRGFIDRDEVRG